MRSVVGEYQRWSEQSDDVRSSISEMRPAAVLVFRASCKGERLLAGGRGTAFGDILARPRDLVVEPARQQAGANK